KIEKVQVSDFYTLEAIDAREAFYVVGSNVYGPMGNELVPFKSEKEAQNFMQEHKGKKILKFKDITPQIVMGLDGQKI
ncbi:MAG TPA: nitrous oxide reductase accessory protein NosL, partial [Nitratifractor sp.]|nr:nitrous oxide reductase accessory protein NosL [Nitratifractor sp.]